MQYRFCNFILDTGQLYLTADGVPVEADARQLQLLRLLIDSYPEPCSQQQLLETLWPDTVVSHWSAGRLVSDTRKLFRHQGYEGPLIQTLHGRGYRLAPELVEQLCELPIMAGETAQPAADAPGPAREAGLSIVPPATSSPAVNWRSLAATGLLLLFAAAIVYFITAHGSREERAPLVIGEAPDARGRILWVDDNPDNNLSERQQFESRGIAVYIATNSEDALMLLSMYRYHAVISDMGRGDEPLAGLKLMERLRARDDQTPYFLYTIMPSESQRLLVAQRGGNGVAVTQEELFDMVLPLFEVGSGAPATP
ncbi:winged helix-turn-helix domain-containing protein [Microbulbifer pacificus]|uniref:Winged helix-turn-helix domain-containing protein n=1 Tax=Microbulbifer pacificus TaxID=407164 RepID=A0AAU0N365_9GAMM|nr:winged helix-turn-helix domain-containing protein [Microbulbifer pacificus]WOX06933.1 winged helix-turn-helix domain-containing protein [Microbulbifer pacificus]